MVVTSIFWMMNEFRHGFWIEGVFLFYSFIKICIDSYINFEQFLQYRFLKLFLINILLFIECKYISSQHLELGRQWKVIVFHMYFVNRRVHIFKTKNLYGNDT
jgi:hypothetical protein